MRISIFGLGYVGTVCAAALARSGFEVLGVDVNETKNAQINEGRSPIVEPGLEELIGEAVGAKRLSATSDHEQAVESSELSLICVGTPSRSNGSLDTSHVEDVARTIGGHLRNRDGRHTVVVRSTLCPERLWAAFDRCSKRRRARAAAIRSGSPTTRSSCARARRSPTSWTRPTRSSAVSRTRARTQRRASTTVSTRRCTG